MSESAREMYPRSDKSWRDSVRGLRNWALGRREEGRSRSVFYVPDPSADQEQSPYREPVTLQELQEEEEEEQESGRERAERLKRERGTFLKAEREREEREEREKNEEKKAERKERLREMYLKGTTRAGERFKDARNKIERTREQPGAVGKAARFFTSLAFLLVALITIPVLTGIGILLSNLSGDGGGSAANAARSAAQAIGPAADAAAKTLASDLGYGLAAIAIFVALYLLYRWYS